MNLIKKRLCRTYEGVVMADKRKNLIKIIHTGRRYLQLDEETYRGFLYDVTKKNSCVLMSTEELEKVVKVLRNKGFTAQKQHFKFRQDKLFQNTQYRKCYSLWQELYNIGGVKVSSPVALNSYLKKICPQFRKKFIINPAEFQKAIEILKNWLARLETKSIDDNTKQQIQKLLFPDEQHTEVENA